MQKNCTICPCVCKLSHLWLSHSLVCTFWLIKGKEKQLIIFLYISVIVFLCYTTYIYIYMTIMVKVFANGSGDQGSISGQVIQKTQKMVCDTFLLNTHPWLVLYNAKWIYPKKGVVTSPKPWWSSYEKGSFQVALD